MIKRTSDRLAPADMVNLARYPITDLFDSRVDGEAGGGSRTGADRPSAEVVAAFTRECRNRYERTGLCALPEFITSQAQRILAEEANLICGDAYFCQSTHNAYLTDRDESLPENDVTQRQERTYVGSVPYDRIGETSHLRRLYMWDPLMRFIGAVLGKGTFYRFADPLGACSVNVFVDGGEHGWHFDESEFTVTLMLQPPETGGAFEYVPQIRGLPNEKDIVSRVLDGDRADVIDLPFATGTLLIFGGHQTLHRVTRVQGERPRLVPVLCYSEQPNLMNSESVRELFWGRTGT